MLISDNICLNLPQFYWLDLQKVMLTSLDFNLYGDGVDCTDEYVEILDGDTVDALSLGKYAAFRCSYILHNPIASSLFTVI